MRGVPLRNRIVLDDVARDAGVSRSTVSLVLRGNPVVAKGTAERVLHSLRKLGYVYNRTAAGLRSKKSHSIGLIEANIKNAFFAAMSVGVEKELEKSGRAMLWANASEQVDKQSRAVELMLEYNVDGLLICPAKGTKRADLEILRNHRVPFVLFSRYLMDWETDYFGADNVDGAYRAASHLISLGHRNIVFVGGSPAASPWHDRTAGFSRALREAGLRVQEDMFFPTDVSTPGGASAVERILLRYPAPTAALCYSDIVAFGVMMGLVNSGIMPGRDFGVVGFDDLDEAALWRPALTTVACCPEAFGVEAAKLLIQRMEQPDGPPVRMEVSGKLIVRESCGGRVGVPEPAAAI
jgi:LacI family transcriptional regulator